MVKELLTKILSIFILAFLGVSLVLPVAVGAVDCSKVYANCLRNGDSEAYCVSAQEFCYQQNPSQDVKPAPPAPAAAASEPQPTSSGQTASGTLSISDYQKSATDALKNNYGPDYQQKVDATLGSGSQSKPAGADQQKVNATAGSGLSQPNPLKASVGNWQTGPANSAIPGSFLRDAKNPGDIVLGFYKYAIGIVGIVGFGAIVYGAILRIIAAGDTKKITDSKQWITGALLGMGLLLGAALLLTTINPRLVQIREINKSIETEIEKNTIPIPGKDVFGSLFECEKKFSRGICESTPGLVDTWKAGGSTDVKSIPDLVKSLNPKIYDNDPTKRAMQIQANLDCARDCQKISLPNVKSGICQGHICSANAELIKRLNEFYDKIPKNYNGTSKWEITEAWPPDKDHDSLDHYNGRAVDIAIRNPDAKISYYIDQLKEVNLGVLNEVNNPSKKSNGPHLHVYLPK